MMGKKMPFLKVVRGHTQYWKGDANFRSMFSRFEKNSTLYSSELKILECFHLIKEISVLNNILP